MSEFENATRENTSVLKYERAIPSRRTDTSIDFLLPDYMGDVKRMLNFKATVLPAGQFVSDSEISFSGIVAYSVLYLDGENKLTEAEFTSDFELEEPIGDSFIDATVKSEVSSLAVRIAGPRKISAKASIASDICFIEGREMPKREFGVPLEMRRGKLKAHNCIYLKSDEIECAEEAESVSGVSAEEIEQIISDGAVKINNISLGADKIKIEGAIEAWCLLRAGGEDYIRIEKTLPVECEIEAKEMPDEPYATAYGTLGSISVGISNKMLDDGGAGASVVFNTVCEFLARIDGSCNIEAVTDAFPTEGECELKYEELRYKEYVSGWSEHNVYNFESKTEELGCPEITEILYCDVKLREAPRRCEAGQLIEEGEMFFLLVGRTDAGAYTTAKVSYPFSWKRKLGDVAEPIVLSDLHLYTPKAFIEGDKIRFSEEVCSFGTVCIEARARILSAAENYRKSEVAAGNCVLTVYYPDESETLWDVAKKYGVPPTSIASSNMLSSEAVKTEADDVSLKGIKMLIINK